MRRPIMEIGERIARAIAGERRSVARVITLIERRDPRLIGRSDPDRWERVVPGAPFVVGITGPPGAGKSTLVDGLVRAVRDRGCRVAVVAVDPSSPFSGGAILGDRIRMERHTGDDGVYVRSLSSRGQLGGLSTATEEVVNFLGRCGFDWVIVETVGVGQSELSVLSVADTAVVVLTPESGDAVQTMKAGLLEIADLFVVNKADRPDADRMTQNLMRMVEWDRERLWPIPVVQTCATEAVGFDGVLQQLDAHLAWLKGEGRPVWDARRAEGRLRLFLDLCGEIGRARGERLLDDRLRASLLSGKVSARSLAGHLQ